MGRDTATYNWRQNQHQNSILMDCIGKSPWGLLVSQMGRCQSHSASWKVEGRIHVNLELKNKRYHSQCSANGVKLRLNWIAEARYEYLSHWDREKIQTVEINWVSVWGFLMLPNAVAQTKYLEVGKSLLRVALWLRTRSKISEIVLTCSGCVYKLVWVQVVDGPVSTWGHFYFSSHETIFFFLIMLLKWFKSD